MNCQICFNPLLCLGLHVISCAVQFQSVSHHPCCSGLFCFVFRNVSSVLVEGYVDKKNSQSGEKYVIISLSVYSEKFLYGLVETCVLVIS